MPPYLDVNFALAHGAWERMETSAPGMVSAMKSGKSGVWNAGSGQPRSFNEMIEGLNRVLKMSLKPEYFDCPYPFYQPHTEADMAATKRDLKIEPRFSLEEGLEDYYKSGWLTKGRSKVSTKKKK